MEKYSVLVARSAVKEIEAIDRKADRARIVAAIQELAAQPRGPGSEKLAGDRDRLRIRVGDYRIVYTVDDKSRTVDIGKVGHRREVYRQ